MYWKLDTGIIDITIIFLSECNNSPQFKVYTENRYMGTLSVAIVSISLSIPIGEGTETRSTALLPIIARYQLSPDTIQIDITLPKVASQG